MDKRQKLGLFSLFVLFLLTLVAKGAYEGGKTRPLGLERVREAFTRTGHERPLPKEASGLNALRASAEVDRTAVLQGSDGRLHVEVTLDTLGMGGNRVPTDFVVVLDRSGSMQGDKLAFGKQALRGLIERLDPRDRLALVTYDDQAEVAFPLEDASREHRSRFRDRIDALTTGGSTNISEGLDLGLRLVGSERAERRAARILLLSDGLANQGDKSLEGLSGRAREALRRSAVMSTIGIGADFDERVMAGIARAGTGAFYYLEKLEVLPEILSAELKTAGETYAEQAELRVELAPGVVLESASGRSPEYRGGAAIVPLGSLYANHDRKVWLTLRVPTDSLREHALGALSVRFEREGAWLEKKLDTLPKVACVADPAEFRRRILRNTWERAVLEEELNADKEKLGEAVRAGTPGAVDDVLANRRADLELARALGSQRVEKEIVALADEAPQTKAYAESAPALRAPAAKRMKSDSFMSRNREAYKNSAAILAH